MSDIALSEDGDILLDEGALALAYDDTYVRQSLEIRLKHFRGEWFRDQSAGTAWYEQILGKSTDLARRAELRRRILGTPRVLALTRLALTLDTVRRVLEIDFEVQLDSGLPLEIRFEVAA